MASCSSIMVPRIEREMRAFSEKLLPAGQPMPFWAQSAMRQHAEYAAADWCSARGLQGLGAAEEPRSTFPSVQAVYDLMDEKPGAIWDVAKWTAVRAALIGAGLFIAGERGWKGLATKSVVASLLVEAVVIGTIQVQESRRKAGLSAGAKAGAGVP